MISDLQDSVFKIKDDIDFLNISMKIFEIQRNNNPVYKYFIDSLGIDSLLIKSVADIPFLPVEFFKKHIIVTGGKAPEIVFKSSGTTGVIQSKHYVTDLAMYERSFSEAFRIFYGDPADYLIIALLPSYTEREGSSLVYMADKLIKMSSQKKSGFFRTNTSEMLDVIRKAKEDNIKVLLLGVSFALLDLAEQLSPDLSGIIVMETGGMKGRRKEITRTEMHSVLETKFNLKAIHSEYGMTELLSQAYSKGGGIFYCPPWMKVVLRDPHDPLSYFTEKGRTGGINIIDLANINSCSFLATSDLGRLLEDGGFEILGRFDNSDVRGCNLLIE
jgi:phenylacetate-coenzyme A ligase PaaK-like adenylate-forming protein